MKILYAAGLSPALLELLDRRVRSSDDLEEGLEAPLLATLQPWRPSHLLGGPTGGVNRALPSPANAACGPRAQRVSTPAQVASPRGNSFGVETRILVKGNNMGGVRGAEDMAAVAAVVATQEDTKGGTAGGRVAVGRSRVRLQKGS